MNRRFLSAALKGALLISAGLVVGNGPVAAQLPSTETMQHEVIIVEAPSVVIHESKAAAGSRARGRGMLRPIEVVSVNRSVGFSDLDLSKASDVAVFRKRIHDAATEACRVLDQRYPKAVYIPVSPNQDCAANAVGNAMKIADQVIAAAKMR